jgi:hypothetical protein
MIKKTILALAVVILFIAFLQVSLSSYKSAYAAKPIVQLKWTNPMAVHDVAVTADGNYLAAVNNTGLHYFDSDSSQTRWQYEPLTGTLISVAISADGDFVVAGDNNGYLHYFNQSTQRTGSQIAPTWTSIDMGGPVEKGTLDMSANGNYTVVGGTGVNIWYYANCMHRTGPSQAASWSYMAAVNDFRILRISANGKYVAGGGICYNGGWHGFVIFFKDAETSGQTPAWFAYSQLLSTITGLALSDDGYAVAAIDAGPIPSTLYYWADATDLTGDPEATWTNPGSFSCIDTTGNGDNVVAGGVYFTSTSVHHWTNARTKAGIQDEDWINLTETNVYDVAISKDGSIMAVPTMDPSSGDYSAYFLTADSNILANFTLPEFANMVSMSAAGTTVAMAGPGYDSLYVFAIETDSTPPSINDVYQQPDKDNVYPNSTVKIFANVTDDQSEVKQVTLNYTNGNGTWLTQTMDPYDTDIYNGTIQAFAYCTNVTYIIIAEDDANNTITSQDEGFTLKYHVVPEFASTTLLIMLIIATSLSVIAYKKRKQ